MHYAVTYSVQRLEFVPRQRQFLVETAVYDVRYSRMTVTMGVARGEEGK